MGRRLRGRSLACPPGRPCLEGGRLGRRGGPRRRSRRYDVPTRVAAGPRRSARRRDLLMTATQLAPTPEILAALAEPERRIEGPLKVTGRARYTADLSLPGLLEARFLG